LRLRGCARQPLPSQHIHRAFTENAALRGRHAPVRNWLHARRLQRSFAVEPKVNIWHHWRASRKLWRETARTRPRHPLAQHGSGMEMGDKMQIMSQSLLLAGDAASEARCFQDALPGQTLGAFADAMPDTLPDALPDQTLGVFAGAMPADALPGQALGAFAGAMPCSHASLPRPQIRRLLGSAVKQPLVLVVAGAGYGKTSSVSDFLQCDSASHAWVQISDFDNLIDHFWANYTSALSAISKDLAPKLSSASFPKTERQHAHYMDMVRSGLSPGRKYIIVMDDFHLIREKAISQFIERSVTAGPACITTILISRTEPDINLIALGERGLTAQISEGDLRFGKEELAQYLSLIGIALPPKTVSDIHADADGWAFAINLIGLSLKNGLPQKDYAFTAVKLNIFKLIEAEIFSVASERLQKLLAKLSLVEFLPTKLLKGLSGDDGLISEMCAISSFIRYDTYADAYRIHHLFLEFLRGKQALLGEAERRGVYEKAAAWCDANGRKMDAVAYYEKAGNYVGLASAAYALTRMTPPHVAEFLLEVLERIPEGAFMESPELHIIKNKALQALARFDAASRQALALIEAHSALPPTPLNCWLLSECYFNLGFIGVYASLHTNIWDFSFYFENGYKYYEASGRMSKGPRERTIVSSYVCRIGYPAQNGALAHTSEIFSRYVGYAIKAKNGMMQGMVDLGLCEAAYFKGELKKAERLAYQAVAKARQAEQFQIENRALFFLLRINIHASNTEKIQLLFKQLENLLKYEQFLNGYTLNDIVAGWFYAQIRQVGKVAGWLRSSFEKSDLNSLLYGLENLVRAKCFLAEKKHHAVLATLDGQDAEYGLEAFLIGRLEVAALKAVCQYHIDDRNGALRTLESAYAISRSDDLDMPFIELGRDMRTLTSAAMKERDCKIPQAWLEKINRKASAYAKNLSQVVLQYQNSDSQGTGCAVLTKRELDILTDLCHGLSKAEIASNRNISTNTVKMVVQMIFSKLGAQNTANAIWIAANRQLIN
jgi:LuxR family maltose regulon positive regulatory protein